MKTSEPSPSLLSARTRFFILVAVISSLGLLTAFAHWCGYLDREGLRNAISSAGILAPLAYVIVASLLMTAWVPRGLLSMIAGALFGVGLGAVLALVMGFFGALFGFLLGRSLGAPYLEQRLESAGARASRQRLIVDFVRARGFWAILTCRVCPIVPCELVSVTSGITKIRILHFFAATIVGMCPGAFLYAALGASLIDESARWLSLVSAFGFLVLTLITLLFLRDLWRRDHRRADTSS